MTPQLHNGYDVTVRDSLNHRELFNQEIIQHAIAENQAHDHLLTRYFLPFNQWKLKSRIQYIPRA